MLINTPLLSLLGGSWLWQGNTSVLPKVLFAVLPIFKGRGLGVIPCRRIRESCLFYRLIIILRIVQN